MKFCCQKFNSGWSLNRVSPLNIRVVKIDLKEVPEINPKYPYRFYLTIGYREGEKNVPSRFLSFCPYCGKDLFKFYKSDEYVNEHNQSFLHL